MKLLNQIIWKEYILANSNQVLVQFICKTNQNNISITIYFWHKYIIKYTINYRPNLIKSNISQTMTDHDSASVLT